MNKKFSSYNNGYNSFYDTNYYLRDSYYKPTPKNLEYYQKKYSTYNNYYDYKNKYNSNNNNKNTSIYSKKNLSQSTISDRKKKIAEDDYLFQKNLMTIEEKLNPNFKPFHYDILNKSKLVNSTLKENNDINTNNNNKLKNSVLYIPKGNSSIKKSQNISLEINFNVPDGTQLTFHLDSINLLNKVEDLKNLIKEKIKNLILKKKFQNYVIQNISLLGSNSFLSDQKLLIEYNISNEIIAIIIYQFNNESSNLEKIVPMNLLPKLTKPGYKTFPEYILLCRMTEEELKNISNFKIYNDYGEVRYLGKVNLLGKNLDDFCDIQKGIIELKGNLNVKKKCILYNINFENGSEKLLDNYKDMISQNNGVFVSYEPNSGKLEWDYYN